VREAVFIQGHGQDMGCGEENMIWNSEVH